MVRPPSWAVADKKKSGPDRANVDNVEKQSSGVVV